MKKSKIWRVSSHSRYLGKLALKYMEVTVRKTDDYKARHRNDVKICVRVVDFYVNILSAICSSRFELCVVIPVDDLGLCRKHGNALTWETYCAAFCASLALLAGSGNHHSFRNARNEQTTVIRLGTRLCRIRGQECIFFGISLPLPAERLSWLYIHWFD